MYLGYQNGKIKFYSEECLNSSFYQLDKQEYTEEVYVYDPEIEEFVLDDEAWKEKQARKEAERIAKLYLTSADVERGIYQATGMDFDDIIALVESSQNPSLDGEGAEGERGDIDIKALKIELKANHFYRGNPYVSTIGNLLGFTSEQLDKFFEFNDWTYLKEKMEVSLDA